MRKLIAIIAANVAMATAHAQDATKLLDAYLPLKDALVAGNNKTATETAGALHAKVQAEPDFKGKGELVASIDKVKDAGNIEKQRAAFADLSTEVWKVIEKKPTAGRDVYYQYCPMKKAYWISAEQAIKNPYYGSAMLTCGRVAETKKK